MCRVHRNCALFRRLISVLHTKGGKNRLIFRTLGPQKQIFLQYVFFWVIPQRLNFICRRFGTIYLFHFHRQMPMKMEQIECSETSAYKIETPENCPVLNKLYSEHGENLKSRTELSFFHLLVLKCWLAFFVSGTNNKVLNV